MNDIASLPAADRARIIGQTLAIAAGVTPRAAHPWAIDYHRRGDMSLAGIMAALGQSPAGFMTNSDFKSAISEAIRVISVETERPRALSHRAITRLFAVPDFKSASVPRCNPVVLGALDHTGELPPLAPTLSEAELRGLLSIGAIVRLSREAIINAQWPLVRSIIEELQIAAYRDEASAVYGVLAANPTLADGIDMFAAARGNIAATGGAPSVETLQSSIKALKNLAVHDVSLGLEPWAIVAPTGLECTLAALFEAGAARLVPGGFFTSPALTGNAWYVLPDPSQRPVIGLVHVGNATDPLIDTKEGFRSDGLGIRARHSFAAVALSPFAIKNFGQ